MREAVTYALLLLLLLLSLQCTLKVHAAARLRAAPLDSVAIVQRGRPRRVALVTMADAQFLNCSLQLIRAARAFGWRHPVFLLAVGDGVSRRSGLGRVAAEELGVEVVQSSGALDGWVANMDVPRVYHAARLSAAKFRKMDVFFNPVFRTFDRVVYVDADGTVAAPLAPLAAMSVPAWAAVALRQNDAALGKPRLWGGELDGAALAPATRARARALFPDTAAVGASCYFVAEMRRLPPPRALLAAARQVLCEFKPGFRFNDQTLINALFSRRLALLPWCAAAEARPVAGVAARARYCARDMAAQRAAEGGLRFMYRHFSPAEKAACVGAAPPARLAGRTGAAVDCAAGGAYDASMWRFWREREA